MGNVLKRDDGFGVIVAQELTRQPLGPGVRVIEVGIAGLHLVQELLGGYDALIVVDAVDRGRPPGTVMVIEPEVDDLRLLPPLIRYDRLADVHYTHPARAFELGRALEVLPPTFLLVGCQPADTTTLERGLTPAVAAAVPVAVREVTRLLTLLRSARDD